ncbi:MAG: deoxyribodipyrimidine photo-lyase [Patescibacteria group bacterium]
MSVDPRRMRTLNHHPYQKGAIAYWMNRDMRLEDNWALLAAQEWAMRENVVLQVVYNLDPAFLGGGRRQFEFKLAALEEISVDCQKKGIGFSLLIGSKTEQDLVLWIKKQKIGGLVTDFSPLRIQRKWLKSVVKAVGIPVIEVDAHNVVPCWIASDKAEYGAYTLRPKIKKLLKAFLTDFPILKKHPIAITSPVIKWDALRRGFKGREIAPVSWIFAGEKAAQRALRGFIQHELNGYDEGRNDPNAQAQSDLSPYFHYGMLSPQRAAFEVMKAAAPSKDKEAYLEELIIRRELSDNFCYYHPDDYDTVGCFPDWAKEDIAKHRKDKREFVNTFKQFESAKTHDGLWNAAQLEMVKHGKMHGYMRMYWAKKILEWSESVEEAMKIAIVLNDRYELDGRDPNGYAGIAWSMGGVHDRPWSRRKVFGRVRYMNRNGCERKFDVGEYIARNNKM